MGGSIAPVEIGGAVSLMVFLVWHAGVVGGEGRVMTEKVTGMGSMPKGSEEDDLAQRDRAHHGSGSWSRTAQGLAVKT